MPYTSHGHAYGLIDVDQPRPRSVARCGGPRLCAKCKGEADTWQNPVEGIRRVRDQQGQHGTWNASDYHRGLYNGLELALSILEEDREPRFRAATEAPVSRIDGARLAGRFRKKPVEVEVEAIRWTGDNAEQIKAFVGQRDNGECRFLLPGEITGAWEHPHVYEDNHRQWIAVLPGYWVVRGTRGEFYPCDPDAFAETYEEEDGAGPPRTLTPCASH